MAEFFYCFQKLCKDLNFSCFNSLHNISYDKTKKEYLCSCHTYRLDFDFFVEQWSSHPRPSSVGTILFDEHEKKVYLIEFKNQKCSNIDNEEIKKKVSDSIKTLKELAKKCNIKFNDYALYVGIVYNDQPKWKRGICSNTIQFGLEYFKEQKLIKDVKTNDIEWFKKKYKTMKTILK